MKRYLVWKDGKFNGPEDEFWTELSGKEFYKLVKGPSGKGRYFIHFFDFEDPEAGDWYYEATRENYDRWHAFQQARYRKLMEKLANPIEFVSLEFIVGYDDNGDPVTLADTIPDEVPDTIYGEVDDILETLTPEERALINLLFLDNYENKSERQIAREIGVNQKVINRQKARIIKKIRGKVSQN